ncbi:MAG TPA: DUF423 domain-containing protein [Chryseosolibacter sp.]|nr:DUF423 domain-containing protein [Chryseosolibacter sp.]
MNHKSSLIAGIVFAFLSVALGAFGAHALKNTLIENGRVETYELAVRYQFFHALALIASGILLKIGYSARIRTASMCFGIGIIVFSGSLYILSLTGITILGAVTPLGGVAFLAGWLFMLLAVVRSK